MSLSSPNQQVESGNSKSQISTEEEFLSEILRRVSWRPRSKDETSSFIKSSPIETPASSDTFDLRVRYLILAIQSLTCSFCPNYKIIEIFGRLKEKLDLSSAELTLIPGQAILSVKRKKTILKEPLSDSLKTTTSSEFALEKEKTFISSSVTAPHLPQLSDIISGFHEQPEELLSFNVKTQGGLNMLKLEAVEVLLDNFCQGFYTQSFPDDPSIALKEAIAELDLVKGTSPIFPDWLKVLSFGGLCLGATPLFGGGFLECTFSFIFGVLFGALLLWGLPLVPGLEPTFNFWSPFVFSLGTRIVMEIMLQFSAWTRDSGLSRIHLNYMSIILPPIIWILPGFSMINGFTDFLVGMRTLGISNIFNAFFNALVIGFGMVMGFYAPIWFDSPTLEFEKPGERAAFHSVIGQLNLMGLSHSLNGILVTIVAFIVCIVFISITFDCHPKQVIPVSIVALLSFLVVDAVSSQVKKILPPEGALRSFKDIATATVPDCFSNFFGGLLAGFLSALWHLATGYSTTPGIFLGIVILAPGTWGARCFFHGARFSLDVSGYFAFGMFAISLSIAVGTLLGRSLVPRVTK